MKPVRKSFLRPRFFPTFCLIFLLSLLSLLRLPAKAATTQPVLQVNPSAVQGHTGDTFTATVRISTEIGAVLLRAEYDPQVLTCTKVQFLGAAKDGYTRTFAQTGCTKAIFTGKPGTFFAANTELAVFTFAFTGTQPGDTVLHFFAEQTTGKDGTLLTDSLHTSVSVCLSAEDTTAALLQELSCPDGSLSPAFSPTVFDYTMQVPFSVTKVNFTAEPLHSGATVLQMKHNLGAGGTQSVIRIKVTSADAVTKQQYTVTVLRLPKETVPPKPTVSPQPTSAPKATVTPAPSPKTTAAPRPTLPPQASSAVSSAIISAPSVSATESSPSSSVGSLLADSSSLPASSSVLSSASSVPSEKVQKASSAAFRFLSSADSFARYLLILSGIAVLLLLVLVPVLLLQKKSHKK